MNFIHTGQSRGFAFAEFNSVEEAKAWYQMKQVAQTHVFIYKRAFSLHQFKKKKTFLFENETKLFSNKKFKSKTNLSYHILIMQRVYKFLITFLLLIFIDSVLF